MSGYITCFDNDGKNMSFKIEDESAYLKYIENWNKTKNIVYLKFPSQAIYDDKYTKAEVKTFPKEITYYACISAICIDSVLRVDKKNYPQVYLEQCTYKIRKRELVSFTDDELDLSSDNSNDLNE